MTTTETDGRGAATRIDAARLGTLARRWIEAKEAYDMGDRATFEAMGDVESDLIELVTAAAGAAPAGVRVGGLIVAVTANELDGSLCPVVVDLGRVVAAE